MRAFLTALVRGIGPQSPDFGSMRTRNVLEIGSADVKLVMNVRGSLIVRDGEPT
jgi:hypothetical protein